MRNLLALFALAILVVGGVGYYKGWFKVDAVTAPDGHKSITVDVDTKKVENDINAGKKEVSEFLKSK